MLVIQQEEFWAILWRVLFWSVAVAWLIAARQARKHRESAAEVLLPLPDVDDEDLREQERQRAREERQRALLEWTLEFELAKEETAYRPLGRRAVRLRRRLDEMNQERKGADPERTGQVRLPRKTIRR